MSSSLIRRVSPLLTGIVVLAVTATSAHAVVVHRYTFNNGNANDSVGTAHGTIVDPGTPQATFTAAGRLDLSANTGGTPGDDAYLDLPNLIIQGAAQSGTSGALSLEWWFTVSEARTWQRLGDFGGPLAAGGGENAANNGSVNFIYVTSNSGRRNGGVEIANNYAPPPDGAGNTEANFGLSGPTAPALPVGVQHHVVGVWDKNDTDGGANLGGTMHLYLNGAEILPGAPDVGGSRAIHQLFDLNNLNDHDNWLGRSQWSDPAFDGAYNEFSIYNHPLSAAEVSANFAAGPVPVPLPTLIVNTVTGATAIKNLATGAIDIDYYEIRSPGGRLNPANGAWNSLSDQNLDAGLPSDFDNSGTVDGADLGVWKTAFGVNANGDADGDGDSDGNDFAIWQRQIGQAAGEGDSWDEAGGVTDNVLAEIFLNSTSRLDVNEQVNLGSAFRTGAAQDLTFRFGIAGENGLTEGLVVYQTTGPASAVPEPTGVVTICALGAATLMARRRRGSAGAQR